MTNKSDESLSPCCVATEQGVVLTLKVVPRSSRDEISGVVGDALKIRIKAPPVDGKANAALLKLLRKQLKVSGSAVELIAGQSARSKRVRVSGLSAETVRARLGFG